MGMENYFAKLLLTSELDDPVYFAKVQQNIADLEKKRVAHFNEHGPMNQHYVHLMRELNMAYLEAKESEHELEVAQQIYQTNQVLHGETSDLTLEALLALGQSYLDNNQQEEAEGIASSLLALGWSEENGPAYDLYIDTLCLQGDIMHAKKEYAKEVVIRRHVLSLLEELSGSVSNQTIMARCALGFCLERMKNFREALEHYIVVRSYLETEPDFATEAELIGLMVHIGRCYRKIGNLEDAHVIYRWAQKKAEKQFGKASSLSQKMQRLMEMIEGNQG